MLSIDLFDSRYECQLREGAVDNLEARRIDDLNMRMLELLDRAKEPAYRKNPDALAGLKRQFQTIKAERDSYFKINPATGMDPTGSLGTTKGRLDDGQVTPTATGLRHQASPGTYGGYEPEPELKGLNKTLTKNLEKGMDIEFKKGGQHNRIQPDVDEGGIPGNVPTEKIPGKEDLLKGRGRSYYEGAEDYAGIYSPEAIALGKRFCEHYNITDDGDVQLAVEIIDSYLDEFKATNSPIDLKKIKSGVADAFRQVYRGMGPGPTFRKKFQEVQKKNSDSVDEHGGGIGPRQHWQDLMQETVTDVRPLWADVYRRLAPKIERHRDSFLAGVVLHPRLNATATVFWLANCMTNLKTLPNCTVPKANSNA